MSRHPPDDLSHLSMLDLFRVEAESQTNLLNHGLVELERATARAEAPAPRQLEGLMRAAHSLKGAARIVNLPGAVRIAHAMEDALVAAQHGEISLRRAEIDLLLQGVDLLQNIARCLEPDLARWDADHAPEIEAFITGIMPLKRQRASGHPSPPARPAATELDTASLAVSKTSPPGALVSAVPSKTEAAVAVRKDEPDRVLRLTADSLNRMLGLAGESLVESRWLHPFSDSMRRLKRLQADLAETMDNLRASLGEQQHSERAGAQLQEATARLSECREYLAGRLDELELFDYRCAHLSHRLYLEVLQCRMRPFGDGIQRFPRMVRDLARSLGKEVRLEVNGEKTQVDRDILDKLESPLAHLLRNAVDHGCESTSERQRAEKNPEAVIRLEARHSAGMLHITVTDDGAGVDPQRIRKAIVRRKLTTAEVAQRLSEVELLEFLFLPGFTLRDTVTELSGRGVGLDAVQNMVKAVRGTVRAQSAPGKGMRFHLQLPLTLSVVRTLLIEVGGEPYAVPLGQIVRALVLPRDAIESLEGRHHFRLDDQRIGLVMANQVLDCRPDGGSKTGSRGPGTGNSRPASHVPRLAATAWSMGESRTPKIFGDNRQPTTLDPQPASTPDSAVSLVVLGDRHSQYGLVVDRFLGERELVVQPLDPRLGKVKDISAAALMEDGSPVLIVDAEDLVRSIEKLIAQGHLDQLTRPDGSAQVDPARQPKRVLAVDDSLTVRELERKLLTSRGYLADVAVDGMDGWNAVRTGHYDLVITDVDMPRLNGIELARLIKQDPQLKSLPVMIVSYKDGEEDRLRGLDAGADYYLTKGSFHDEQLMEAVLDLIGPAQAGVDTP